MGPGDVEVLRAVHDSRHVRPGDLFVAVPGTKVDGHQFIQMALDSGASAIMAEHALTLPAAVPLLVVRGAREALALAAHVLAGSPTERLTVCGITGTSGKTTTAFLVRSILEQAGWPTGLLGTVAYVIGRREIPSDMTTPDANDLAGYFAQMVEAGLKAAVMEVSSHALDQRRTAGIRFSVAAFTNLSPEHRDYHLTMDDYRAAKGRLFEMLDPQAAAVLNADDPVSAYYKQVTHARVLWYGLKGGVDVTAEDVRLSLSGTRFMLVTPRGRAEARTALLGLHNVQNCLAAAAVGEALGLPLEKIVAGIAALPMVRGRLEAVPGDRPFTVLVDYAHKTDALEHCLGTVHDLVHGHGRLIAVFGCGGNRDRKKRPDMAKVAERLADRVIVTSDNPRNEEPQAIAAEIVAGFSSMQKVTVELDRRAAIALAISEARPGDAVVIAGKGHETYQQIGDVKRPFDDREVAAEILRSSPGRLALPGRG
jgi:UDP-N-acetylmuramoyl-L-alanyl-D-glutamate--2,6-diaminopimelate ligase